MMAMAFAPSRATVGMVKALLPAVRTRPPAAVKPALTEIIIFRYRNGLVPDRVEEWGWDWGRRGGQEEGGKRQDDGALSFFPL